MILISQKYRLEIKNDLKNSFVLRKTSPRNPKTNNIIGLAFKYNILTY